jgi:hypothetical protein
MAELYRRGLQKELEIRAVPLNTAVSTDTYQLLLTKDSLKTIANHASAIVKRKLTESEIRDLINFIRRLPETQFYRKPYGQAQKEMAQMFLVKNRTMREQIEDQEDIANLTKVSEDTSEGSISDYQKKEVMQMSASESSFKAKAFPDRRGNAIVDRGSTYGNRSLPDGIAPRDLKQEDVNEVMFLAMKSLKEFLDPESLEDFIYKSRESENYHTFEDIELSHQTIQLDSRNRLPTGPVNEYQWNIHTAGKPGYPGDVKIQDTLQYVIEMQIGSFWLPLSVDDPINTYYGKIRMLIREFSAQATQVTEFLDPVQTDPSMYSYHFEFNIVQQSLNRVLLKPVNSKFRFRTPMARVETITIVFREPFMPVAIQPDRGIYTVTYGNPTLFTTTLSNNLSTGDLVYIINSDSGTVAIDALLNRQKGWIVTRIDNFNFTIQVDTSSLSGTETGVSVYYGSKRTFFELAFTSVEQ